MPVNSVLSQRAKHRDTGMNELKDGINEQIYKDVLNSSRE